MGFNEDKMIYVLKTNRQIEEPFSYVTSFIYRRADGMFVTYRLPQAFMAMLTLTNPRDVYLTPISAYKFLTSADIHAGFPNYKPHLRHLISDSEWKFDPNEIVFDELSDIVLFPNGKRSFKGIYRCSLNEATLSCDLMHQKRTLTLILWGVFQR